MRSVAQTVLGSLFGFFGLATVASLPFPTQGGPWDAGSGGGGG
ncbi:hypothetical protein [Mycobacterium sp. 236(2023)]|nr:hypothetical protein [Mycobacterium sp. 236(2023)]MDG4663732.1 hypothetical protein [Mycobacterium sp. 236(2023)]